MHGHSLFDAPGGKRAPGMPLSAATGMVLRAMTGWAVLRLLATLALLTGSIALPAIARAQDQPGSSIEEIRQQKQNPLSGLRSLYIQDDYATFDGKSANVFSLQPVWPFRVGEDWKLVTYTIVPEISLPPGVPGGSRTTGLGNILFNGFFRPAHSSGSLVWGIGPAIELPTRSDPALGSDRVSLGPAGLLFYAKGAFSAGAVIQNYWSLGGSGINQVNEFNLQYFFNYNLPKGWYLLSNATITADWLVQSQDRWTVPVGAGIGRVFTIGHSKLAYSTAFQWLYNVERPDYAPYWSAMLQFQIIFSPPGG